jgi:hypothetical protein
LARLYHLLHLISHVFAIINKHVGNIFIRNLGHDARTLNIALVVL